MEHLNLLVLIMVAEQLAKIVLASKVFVLKERALILPLGYVVANLSCQIDVGVELGRRY